MATTIRVDEGVREQAQILAAYAVLRADPQAWADYGAELAEWDETTGDGLAADQD